MLTRHESPVFRKVDNVNILHVSDYNAVIYLRKTSSTMDDAQRLALLGQPAPFVVITDVQDAGRGTNGRPWYAEPFASVLMTPFLRLPSEEAIPYFADLVALKSCETLREVFGTDEIQMKWPNDLVAHGKKLGGFLVENVYDSEGSYLGTSAGIGINVHSSAYKTDYGAISLDEITGLFVFRKPVVKELLRAIRFVGTDAEILKNNENALSLYNDQLREYSSLVGHDATVKQNGIIVAGAVSDVQIGKGMLVDGTWIHTVDGPVSIEVN